ncbi:Eco57I restriction-modification methylase domain-containing protein, partial [Halobacterium salinarum]|uniref:Eco57I restriction-modification methylase domain-containing protein n=1 Tax=Halobacterium salinarum TaxID=2242 RepID=UPI001F3EE055
GEAQIAALSLYLKAKGKSPDVTIPQLNIVSADAVLINGDRKEEVMSVTQSELEKEILEQIWTSFDNIREWGSLVRIEDQIDELLDEYRETFESKGQAQFTTDGDLTTQSTFISGNEEETWDELKNRLMRNIRNLAEEALEQDDLIEEMFAGEVSKTVELLDLLIHDYDVVVTNPPYLGSGKMNSQLKEFVKDNYTGKSDLYTAFIERCSDFTNSQGYVSMITMETFMFLYSYRGLRSELLNKEQFTEFLHVRNRDEGYLNTAFVFRSKEDYVPRTRFIRLINESEKEKRLGTIIRDLRGGTKNNEVYEIDQDSFLNIGRQPFL